MTDECAPDIGWREPDPWPTPARREPRGLFPAHDDRPRRVLTLAEARTIARDRLEAWRRNYS